MIQQIHKIMTYTFIGVIIMSIALMYFVYSFDYTSLEFYLAIVQAVVMEFSIKWFFRKYGAKKV
jgi:hypothetical protein